MRTGAFKLYDNSIRVSNVTQKRCDKNKYKRLVYFVQSLEHMVLTYWMKVVVCIIDMYMHMIYDKYDTKCMEINYGI